MQVERVFTCHTPSTSVASIPLVLEPPNAQLRVCAASISRLVFGWLSLNKARVTDMSRESGWPSSGVAVR